MVSRWFVFLVAIIVKNMNIYNMAALFYTLGFDLWCRIVFYT